MSGRVESWTERRSVRLVYVYSVVRDPRGGGKERRPRGVRPPRSVGPEGFGPGQTSCGSLGGVPGLYFTRGDQVETDLRRSLGPDEDGQGWVGGGSCPPGKSYIEDRVGEG